MSNPEVENYAPTVLTLSDDVWRRVVQILQEGMLTGVDVTDLLRQVRVQLSPDNSTELVLTPEYRQQVKDGHERMVKQANDMRQLQALDCVLPPKETD